MELEHRCGELKTSLFKERDRKQMLQQELDASNAAILLSGYPTTQLLEAIARKDTELARCHSTLKSAQSEITALKQMEVQLRKDLAETQKHLNEVQTLRSSEPKSICHKIGDTKSSRSNHKVQFSRRDTNDSKVHHQLSGPSKVNIPPSPVARDANAKGIHLRKPLTFSKVSRSTE